MAKRRWTLAFVPPRPGCRRFHAASRRGQRAPALRRFTTASPGLQQWGPCASRTEPCAACDGSTWGCKVVLQVLACSGAAAGGGGAADARGGSHTEGACGGEFGSTMQALCLSILSICPAPLLPSSPSFPPPPLLPTSTIPHLSSTPHAVLSPTTQPHPSLLPSLASLVLPA